MERLLLLWDEIDDLVGRQPLSGVPRPHAHQPAPVRMDSVATILLAGAVLATQKSLIQPW